MSSLSELISNITEYQNSSAGIQFKILDYHQRMTNNEITIVDPTNPFIFLLEAAAAGTASSTLNLERNLRKRYVSLAQKMDDLYFHMTDEDYLDVFALPSKSQFTFIVQLDTLLSSMVDYPEQRVKRVRLPSTTQVLIKDYAFRLSYPLVIEVNYAGGFKIQYDRSKAVDYFNPTSDIVNYHITQNSDGSKWLVFTLEAPQLKVTDSYFTAHSGSVFREKIAFPDQFHYVKVYHSDEAGNWYPLSITFSEEIYDPSVPTATCRLGSGEIEVTIPSVYITTNLIGTNIHIEVYSTLGPIVVNPTDLMASDFSVDFTTNDPLEQTDEVLALQSVSMSAVMSGITNGGRVAKTYEQVKQSCIDNTLGIPEVPITEIQLKDLTEAEGFTLIKTVDKTTSRTYKALRDLPDLDTNIPKPNLTMTTLMFTEESGVLSGRAKQTGKRTTLLSNTLFSVTESATTIVPNETQQLLAVGSLDAKIEACASLGLRYTPLHYVFDNGTNDPSLSVRPYLMDNPAVLRTNYRYLNTTALAAVSVANTQIKVIPGGYRLYLETQSNDVFKQLPLEQLFLKVALNGNVTAFAMPLLLGKTTANELMYQIDLLTDYDITEQHQLQLTNFAYLDSGSIVYGGLEPVITVSFQSTKLPNGFISDAVDTATKPNHIPQEAKVISEQDIYLHLGDYLPWVWRKELKLITEHSFERYAYDIPRRYSEDVYAIDDKTNSIFSVGTRCKLDYTKLHQSGDVVMVDGEIDYLHRADDVKLDANGNPILKLPLVFDHKFDFVTVDASYLLATDPAVVSLRNEINSLLLDWSNDKLGELNKDTLENTEIYYAAKYLSTYVTAKLDGSAVKDVPALQDIVITVFTTDYVLRSPNVKSQIERAVKQVIQSSIQDKVIVKELIRKRLSLACGDAVTTFKIAGLVDDNVEVIEVLSDVDRLGLRKLPVLKPEGFIGVEDKISIQFVLA